MVPTVKANGARTKLEMYSSLDYCLYSLSVLRAIITIDLLDLAEKLLLLATFYLILMG